MLDLHQKTQSHPHPLRWLEELKRDWARTPEHLPDTGCGRYLMEDALRKADFWSRRLTQAVEDMEDYPAVYKAYGDRFLEAAQALEHLRDKAEQGWDSLGQAVPVFRRMGAVRGDENAACRDRSKAVLEQCKKALKDIQATFSVPEEELLEDLRQMAPAMLALLSLTARFTLRYQAEKVRRNVMDFSDQEHYAIDLLTDGQGQPTDLARQVASRYREVMVDEYQDSNQVQNCIFRALSDRERRLFAVGDVKQSIYRFRAGGPHHLSGEVPVLCPGGGSGGGPAPEGAAEPEFPLPPGGAGRHQLRVPVCYVPGNGGDGLRRRRAAVLRRGGGVPAPAGHGAGAALHQRGEHPGGELRPDGDGGPVHGPPHPAAAGREIPGAGGGRPAPAGGAGGHRHSHALPPGQAGGLYGGSAPGEYPLHQRGKRGFFQHPGGGGDGVVSADHRQPPAGCAADRRAAVAAVRLFGGPPGPDPGAAAGGGLLRRPVPGRRRGHGGLPAAAGGAAAGGPGHDGGPPAVEALYGVPRPGGVRGHGGRSRPEGEPHCPVYLRRSAGGGWPGRPVRLRRPSSTTCWRRGGSPPSPPGPPAAGCRS